MHQALQTQLQARLGCRYPIIQTAMGWISTPDLVVATSKAGGFGFLAGAVMLPAEVATAIDDIRARTDQPFGVNYHSFQPGAEDIVDIIIDKGVRAVSYGRAPSAKSVAKFKDAGVLCVPTVGAVRHAEKAVAQGADIIVIQGGEGGGHTGSVPTTLLLPQVVDAIDVPVVAAGGFRDGRGLVAALAFGAQGIAMGTRFLLTEESPVPMETKARYIKAGVNEIVVSKQLDGIPQRMILNRVLRDLENSTKIGLAWRAVKNGLAFRKVTGVSMLDLIKSGIDMARNSDLTLGQTMMAANAPVMIQKAMVEGKPQEGILPSGQVAGLIDDIPGVGDLISRIVAEAEERLNAMGVQG